MIDMSQCEQPSIQDLEDYGSDNLSPLRFRPAEPGDVRFEIIPWEEPEMDATHTVIIVDEHGAPVETHTTNDPYGLVEAHREMQDRHDEAERRGIHPLEVEFEPFGRAWQREQEQRRYGM